MPTVFCTIGLPASGKSTTARRMAQESDGLIREVTKDVLRLHPNAPQSHTKIERWVVAERDRLVIKALRDQCSIVVHDTNLNPIHSQRLAEIAKEHGAEFTILDFTDVSVEECIRRDRARENSVGETVIWEMWQRWLYKPPHSTPQPETTDAVIVDIDGTLARMTQRRPFDWDRVGEDDPVVHVIELVRDLHAAGTKIVYVSGRDGSCHEATQQWLDEHVGVPGDLYMRPANDHRADTLVKREIYEREIRGRYRIRFVLDDRNSVVHMWRTVIGVPVLQVDYGHF